MVLTVAADHSGLRLAITIPRNPAKVEMVLIVAADHSVLRTAITIPRNPAKVDFGPTTKIQMPIRYGMDVTNMCIEL
ncbi:hypothetical protein DPMN_058361 [Dreissena polymorpha]|uniref:Uncharacterized protein n=1 Tax=Dreissena polymorpha TaxID=45954 RepID=A0A9D4C207_DREPO|nr:hypothetical protein DPMN_058361 [Dreissena polymorpha]